MKRCYTKMQPWITVIILKMLSLLQRKKVKYGITVLLTCNMKGTIKIKPLVIGRLRVRFPMRSLDFQLT
jgi:hypothetical protein